MASEDELTSAPRSAPLGARIGVALRSLPQRPVLVTFLLGVVFLVIQTWWIARVRHMGAFNVDEEGGLAAALRFQRSINLDPRPMITSVFGTRNGPLVPLVSVGFLLPFSRSATTAMMAQPLLVVLAGVGVAGAVNRLGSRLGAIVGGLVAMLLPISVVSSRSYQYSTGVAAAMALGLWALLASDRGHRRWPVIGFGAALAAMVLSRTMAVGFVPGMLLAMLLVVRRDRRTLGNLAWAAGTFVLLAGIWWAVQFRAIAEYLYVNAFGERAHYWGQTEWGDRLRDHLRFFYADFRAVAVVGALSLLLTAAAVLVARFHGRRAEPASAERAIDDAEQADLDALPVWRGVAAIWAATLMGFAALLSTSNVGYWFAHPMDVLLVGGVVGLVVAAPTPRAPWPSWWRVPLGVGAVATVAFGFALSLDPTGAVGSRKHSADWVGIFVSNHATLQSGNYVADLRSVSADETVRRDAAAEWLESSVALADQIDALIAENGPITQSIIGEIHLFNANTIALTAEVEGKGIAGIQVVNTLEPPDDELREQLTPHVWGSPRILVVIHGRSLGFPDGRGRDRFERLAVQAGWQEGERIRLPDGGYVAVFTHPDSIDEASRGAP